MHKSKCPVCHSLKTIKYGSRNGKQTYKCTECGYRFRNTHTPTPDDLWRLYQENKQTVSELSARFNLSPSTIKRRLSEVSKTWVQPPLSGGGFVHLDATNWAHKWGVMIGLDALTGFPLYMEFIKNETNADYVAAVNSIEARGYEIKGLIIDGKKSLFKIFAGYKIQMCQFHMKQIIRRYLTNNPRLKASRALKEMVGSLTSSLKENFEQDYTEWKKEWKDTLSKRSILKSGKEQYTHKRLHSAMSSMNFYLPYLFTYQLPECQGMPNTNNKLEGTFTDLKKNVNNHSGMIEENRKRFIIGFFLALVEAHSMSGCNKKQDPL